MLEANYWLPKRTSWGSKPKCDNCANDCENKRNGWICGDWEEAEQIQLTLMEVGTNDSKGISKTVRAR